MSTNQIHSSQILKQKLVIQSSQEHTGSLLVRVEPLHTVPEAACNDGNKVENQAPLYYK